VPGSLGIDWYYLFYLPLIEATSPAATWAFVMVLSVMLMAIPWLPPRARPEPRATVNLANCNGCERCESDCPYNAIQMWPRTDDLPFEREARVDPKLCVGCGICAGSCPTATPFRRRSSLVPGIDIADRSVADLRDKVDAADIAGSGRVLVFACDHGAIPATGETTGTVTVPCVGALPPSFIDYALSRNIADGVMLAGCADCNCHHRTGIDWTEARIARTRDPYLRARVPRDRLTTVWADADAKARADRAVQAFHERLMTMPPAREPRRTPTPEGETDA
jgi:ferredoxin/coenzyme F420-reducing hydrogenase delta subunit